MSDDKFSGPAYEAAVSAAAASEVSRLRAEDAEKAEKEAATAERQDVLDRMAAVEATCAANSEDLETFAEGYRKISSAVEDVEEGQLSSFAMKKVRNSSLTNSAGASALVVTLIELARWVMGG